MSKPLARPSKIVDLHADAFLRDIDDYDLDELLANSLDYLREQLDAAIYWSMPEIKFIHGKGKGVLRNAVYAELQIYKDAGVISHFHPFYTNEDIVVVFIGI